MTNERLTMDDLIRDFVERRVWALVGATSNPRKFGNIILRDLRRAGYSVYAINHRETAIDGAPAYPTLADLPVKPEVVDIVVPPAQTEQIGRQCHALGLTRVWMQPGAESDDAIAFCRAHGIQAVYDACAMVEKRYWT